MPTRRSGGCCSRASTSSAGRTPAVRTFEVSLKGWAESAPWRWVPGSHRARLSWCFHRGSRNFVGSPHLKFGPRKSATARAGSFSDQIRIEIRIQIEFRKPRFYHFDERVVPGAKKFRSHLFSAATALQTLFQKFPDLWKLLLT